MKLSAAFIVIISANNIFLKTAKAIKESNKPTIPPTIVNTKFIQFELWHDCNNRCKFCHSCTLGDIDKIKSIDFISEKLDRKEILDEIGTIGLIGGEIFDD